MDDNQSQPVDQRSAPRRRLPYPAIVLKAASLLHPDDARELLRTFDALEARNPLVQRVVYTVQPQDVDANGSPVGGT
jgi:hypothetical protein